MPKVENGLQFVPRAAFSQQEATRFFRYAQRIVRKSDFDILIMYRTGTVPKLLVVTSRRLGNAWERNRIRRRIKAIFHTFQPLSHEYDCVVIVKKTALQLTFSDLAARLTSLLVLYAPSSS